MTKTTISQRGNKTIYRLERRIICYREGCRVYFGKPSDSTHNAFDALSEDKAHEYCLDWCSRIKWERMKYENPVAYKAHIVLDVLSKRLSL